MIGKPISDTVTSDVKIKNSMTQCPTLQRKHEEYEYPSTRAIYINI